MECALSGAVGAVVILLALWALLCWTFLQL
jgi:hypothetical protein